MSEVRHGTPTDVDCGDVFEIEDRRATIIWSRQHVGSVGVTTQTKNTDTCSCKARWYAPVSDGTFIGVCTHHLEKVR